jgi:hypothetical protein
MIKNRPLENSEYCHEYYNGLLNTNHINAMRGMISYYDKLFKIHDEYIQAYNDEYQKGNIGNGKNYGQNLDRAGFEFELYPKSHPVLKNKNFNLISSKYNPIVESIYYYYSVPLTSILSSELSKDEQYFDLFFKISRGVFLIMWILLYNVICSEFKLKNA